MSKTEQKACLSTCAPPRPSSQPLPRHPPRVGRDDGAARDAQQARRSTHDRAGTERAGMERRRRRRGGEGTAGRPDYLLVCCFVLVYLELGWLILLVLRSYSRH